MADEQKRACEENQERWSELMENIKVEQEAEQQAAVASYLDEEAEEKQKGFIDQILEAVASTIGAGREQAFSEASRTFGAASQLEERDTGGVSSSSRPPPRRKNRARATNITHRTERKCRTKNSRNSRSITRQITPNNSQLDRLRGRMVSPFLRFSGGDVWRR